MKVKIILLFIVFICSSLILFGQTPYLVKDIYSGYKSGSPSVKLILNGKLYFQASNELGMNLWETDGTDSGTIMVKDIIPGNNSNTSGLGFLGVYNDQLIFRANDGVHGMEIWKSDGTESGTILVKDIAPVNVIAIPYFLKPINNKILFINTNSIGNNYERSLWVTNLTDSGTNMIKLIDNRSHFQPSLGSTYLNNQIYFWMYSSALETSELWKTDGTIAGTIVVDTILGKANSITTYGNKIYFITSANIKNNTYGLYVSDGTNQGTQLLKPFNTFNQPIYNVSPKILFEYNGNIIFVANDTIHGLELWKTDGTLNGTTLLKDINIGAEDGIVNSFYTQIGSNGKLYFNAMDSTGMNSIWMTDGTTNGTQLIKNTYNDQKSQTFWIISFNDYILYLIRNKNYEYEIWMSDGIVGGKTGLIQTIPDSYNPNNFKLLGNTLFLNLTYPTLGEELFAIDLSSVILSKPAQKNIVSVYPNPVSEKYIYIENTIENDTKYVIYDTFGHKFKENIVIDGKIDVSEFPVGLYLLKTNNGIAKFVKK